MIVKNQLEAFFRDKSNIVGLALAVFGAYLLFPIMFTPGMAPMPHAVANLEWLTLDPSWNAALNFAKVKDMTFGTEFVFTYGPLGWLCTRITWGQSKWILLFADLFFLLNYFLILLITFVQSKNKIITSVLIVSILILFPRSAGAAVPLVLMGMLIFWVRQSMDDPKPAYYVLQISIVVLLFFIKFNTGLIVFPLFFAGLLYNLLTKKTKIIYLVLYIIAPFLLILALVGPLNVALIPYIKSGFELITGFNDLMYVSNQIPNSGTYMFVIVVLLSILIFFNIFKEARHNYFKGAVILFLFGTTVFVLYKQAFVRADESHIVDFFIFIPLIILCNVDLHRNIKNIVLKGALLIVLTIPFYVLYVKQAQPIVLAEKFSKANYFPVFKDCTPDYGVNFTQGLQMPDSLKAKIGHKTVDVYPWNIKLLLQNNLNYLPRPICQSYTAYTPHLQELNFNHYNDIAKAPEYVIYQFLSIDGRYPLFDEPKMNLALLLNYEVASAFEFQEEQFLLLHKKAIFKPIKFIKIDEYALMVNDPLVPKEGVFYTVEAYNSFSGKVASVYEHAPEINLLTQILYGEARYFKTSKGLLQCGIFSTDFIANTNKANAFFNQIGTGEKVRFYKFLPVESAKFTDKLRITEYKIVQ